MISLRKYTASDFEKSVEIREINGEEARERWRGRIERSGAWDDHYFHLAIELDGELVGDLQVRHCQQAMPPGSLELGLEIDPARQGQGIGTEVLKLAAEKFFADGAHRISGSTDVSNIGMIRAFEKAGWQKEGILRGLFNDGGVLHDYVSYSVLKS
jgi:RimJ/RimL family protein N-acetyltransferase